MEKLFRGYVNTSFALLKKHNGKPTIEESKLKWIILVNEKEYEIYDYLPLEFSNLIHKWRVNSEYKDLNDLEEYINTLT